MSAWKPGDVASILKTGTQPAFRTDRGWTYIDGSTQGAHADEWDFRPLVVIDPESVEQIDRLLALIDDTDHGFTCGSASCGRDTLASVLREFANPKPRVCPAVLVIGGERIECECERDPGHVTDHRNDSIGQGVRWSA